MRHRISKTPRSFTRNLASAIAKQVYPVWPCGRRIYFTPPLVRLTRAVRESAAITARHRSQCTVILRPAYFAGRRARAIAGAASAHTKLKVCEQRRFVDPSPRFDLDDQESLVSIRIPPRPLRKQLDHQRPGNKSADVRPESHAPNVLTLKGEQGSRPAQKLQCEPVS